MPWSQLSPMDQKTQFIADYLRRSLSITELFRHGDRWEWDGVVENHAAEPVA
jgi:hypothetical protein